VRAFSLREGAIHRREFSAHATMPLDGKRVIEIAIRKVKP